MSMIVLLSSDTNPLLFLKPFVTKHLLKCITFVLISFGNKEEFIKITLLYESGVWSINYHEVLMVSFNSDHFKTRSLSQRTKCGLRQVGIKWVNGISTLENSWFFKLFHYFIWIWSYAILWEFILYVIWYTFI